MPNPGTMDWHKAVEIVLGGREALEAALASGTAQPGSTVKPIVHKIPLSFDTPGLENGIDVYTPKVGEILYDAWFQVSQPWNGTTPKGDIATAAWFALQEAGLWGVFATPVDLTNPATDFFGLQGGGGRQASGGQAGASLLQSSALVFDVPANVGRAAPAKFTTTDPLQVVISQDPTTIPGVGTGATQGQCELYLVVLSP